MAVPTASISSILVSKFRLTQQECWFQVPDTREMLVVWRKLGFRGQIPSESLRPNGSGKCSTDSPIYQYLANCSHGHRLAKPLILLGSS